MALPLFFKAFIWMSLSRRQGSRKAEAQFVKRSYLLDNMVYIHHLWLRCLKLLLRYLKSLTTTTNRRLSSWQYEISMAEKSVTHQKKKKGNVKLRPRPIWLGKRLAGPSSASWNFHSLCFFTFRKVIPP